MLASMSSSCSQRALLLTVSCSSAIRMLSPTWSPWNLCATGNLGSMESNVMAGRALFGRFQLPDGLRRCAIFLLQEIVMQGTSRAADYRAYRRIAPKSLELVVVSRPVAFAFCGRLLVQQPAACTRLDAANRVPRNLLYTIGRTCIPWRHSKSM